jgi:hypothetical protein
MARISSSVGALLCGCELGRTVAVRVPEGVEGPRVGHVGGEHIPASPVPVADDGLLPLEISQEANEQSAVVTTGELS